MKQVRIDNRTIIEVDNSVPDELARKRYLKRVKENKEVESSFNGHRSKGGTRNKTIPRQDVVFKGDNTMRRRQYSR